MVALGGSWCLRAIPARLLTCHFVHRVVRRTAANSALSRSGLPRDPQGVYREDDSGYSRLSRVRNRSWATSLG
jgi:hypothetical protein